MSNINNILQNFLGTTNWNKFTDEYWQKKVFHVQREQSDFFSPLVNRKEIQSIINTHGGEKDFVISLIGNKTGAEHQNFAKKPKSYWSPENVTKAYELGATIRLGNVATYSNEISRLQQHLEAHLQTDVSTNLYLTPEQSNAFGAHYDDHDVFIVQVEGSKTWKIFSPPEHAPIEVLYRGRYNWLQKELPGKTRLKTKPPIEKEWKITLKAGDLLYVPRGVVHQVFTENEDSLHLTMAVTVITWYEVVVQSLLETLKKSDALRSALPPNFANCNFSHSEFSKQIELVKSDLKKHLTSEIMESSLNEMAKQFIISRKTYFDEQTQEFEQLSLESCIKIKEDIIYRLEEDITSITLYFSGDYLTFPIRAQSILEYTLQQQKCIVKDFPTLMNDNSKLVVAKRLLEEGFIEIIN